jgi:glycolate oxidase FAD binding subunit
VVAELRARVGDDAVSEDTAAFAIAGRAPACVVSPTSIAQASEVLALAQERSLAVVPTGNATHLHTGSPPRRYDLALSTRQLTRVVAHEAADMTVTVEAGITLAGLNTTLARAGQWLPLDPPAAERVTIGGVIAGDLNGPLRYSQGKARDLLIGITAVLANGSVAKGGGRVVKNVAGYDLCKLFTGSLGTLGVIVEATFKLRPRPAQTRALWLETSDLKQAADQALTLLDSDLAPLFLEVLDENAAVQIGASHRGAAVVIGLGGLPEEIDAQRATVARTIAAPVACCAEREADNVTAWLRDFPRQRPGVLTARVSLLPAELAALLPRIAPEASARNLRATLTAHLGSGIARVHVEGSDALNGILFAEWLRLTARERSGWVVFDALCDDLHGRIDPFGNSTTAVRLMRGIKDELDPDRVLSPGRFLAGI